MYIITQNKTIKEVSEEKGKKFILAGKGKACDKKGKLISVEKHGIEHKMIYVLTKKGTPVPCSERKALFEINKGRAVSVCDEKGKKIKYDFSGVEAYNPKSALSAKEKVEKLSKDVEMLTKTVNELKVAIEKLTKK